MSNQQSLLHRLVQTSDTSTQGPRNSVSASVMIASHFGRVARATTSFSSCTAHLGPAATLSAQSSSFNSSQKPTQRRLSSSKASCPPDEGPNGARPSTATQATPQPSRSPTSRSNGTKQTRGRKQKESDKRAGGQDNASKQMTSSAFDNLPSVPTTSHMHPAGRMKNLVLLEWLQ